MGVGVAMVKIPIYLMNKGKSLVLVAGRPPEGMVMKERFGRELMIEEALERRKPSPIETALKYAEALREPSVVSKAQVARRFGVSQARVCQMLKLLDLDEGILDFLKKAEYNEGTYISERRLRPIATLQNRNQQIRLFNELISQLYKVA